MTNAFYIQVSPPDTLHSAQPHAGLWSSLCPFPIRCLHSGNSSGTSNQRSSGESELRIPVLFMKKLEFRGIFPCRLQHLGAMCWRVVAGQIARHATGNPGASAGLVDLQMQDGTARKQKAIVYVLCRSRRAFRFVGMRKGISNVLCVLPVRVP
jgi:hypothetical protein